MSEAVVAFVTEWIKTQKPQAPQLKSASAFHRNLEEALDLRRADHAIQVKSAAHFWKNLTATRDSCCTRADLDLETVTTRNYSYIEEVEAEIAAFHGAESALIVNSGWDANTAIYAAIPRPGDAIVYDELVHASTHDGMTMSLAQCRKQFRHNDLDSLKDAIAAVLDTQPQIVDGSRSLLISVESIYSMDGDVCPLLDMLDVAREMCPKGNAVFIVDEAHATGVLGPKGAGLVSQLGVQNQIAIRMHTCGKSLASNGAVILSSEAVRNTIINYARSVIYTTAPSFPLVAGIRAGYKLMASGRTQKYQDNVQHLVRHFFATIESNPHWAKAQEMGILDIPVLENWKERDFVAHIVPLRSRQRYVWWLVFQLQLSGISAFPVDYPTVPRGQSRIRLMFHAANTDEEVEFLAKTICEWAAEMIEIELSPDGGNKPLPKAARKVYALMAANA
ncbi:Pyridoxal phosphate-dependent transferase, major domain protein [Teratosphaeria destructans]|uniref:Pyridoxal phosphate-dependent transferase, major domain protein n=1 Tax=Teratosphaeria destructans TaxID=418781 RepID=A0A9W7T1D5_9PEZI|nr:Pyridoxal phosphate-dependent transferase, major domain protein [Teratosphaeria destructans]